MKATFTFVLIAFVGFSITLGRALADGEGPQPVRVTTFMLDHPGVDETVIPQLMRALDEGLKRNPRLEMKDLETRLAEFAQEVPQDQIDEGRLLLQEGQKALTALELPAAIKKLTQAVDVLSKVLPHIKKQELADAMMALAAAEYENGDKKGAQKTLMRLMTWRSDYKLDTNKYPPDLIAPVEEARKEVEKQKRGSLEIHSEPPAAQAYVDGKYVGVTPTFAEGLPIGEHWVTLKREGYRKAVMAATVNAKLQQLVEVTLERSGKYLLVEQSLKGVEKTLGQAQLDPSADNLKEVLFIDHAVFLRVKPSGAAGSLDVDAYLYDVRTRRRLTRVTRTVPIAEAEKQLSTLASTLYLNVSYEAEIEGPKDAPLPKAQTRTPFYKTWWFWTASGVAVAGIIAAAILIPRPKDCGGGNFCPGFSF
ncbi:MAG TPA: PEGA domain-containing protein [Polyangia bacterium]|nr:PEGA domain-containing protein [Polyangia bacterium]